MTLKDALDALDRALDALETWDRDHPRGQDPPSALIAYRVLLGQARERIATANELVGYVALDTGELKGS